MSTALRVEQRGEAVEVSVESELGFDEILARVPQREPFLFVDRLIAIDVEGVRAECFFAESSDFYKGHFPGNPVTPGVILVEAMAQAGLIVHAIYLLGRYRGALAGEMRPAFTEAEVEFLQPVPPGTRVTVESQLEFFRRGKMRSRVRMLLPDGRCACEGRLAGVGFSG